MIRKLHIKPAFNTVSTFFTNIKPISTYGLLTTLFALFTMTASMVPAQAELVDLSNREPVTQISISNANWVVRPILRIESHCINTMSTGDKLTLLLYGSINKAKLLEYKSKKAAVINAWMRMLFDR